MFLDFFSEKSFTQTIEPYFFAFHHFFFTLGFKVSLPWVAKRKKKKVQ
jgi:hypothetical protein